MKKFSAGIAGAVVSFVATAAVACDVEYVIQPDDTLAIIAETAYGESNYQLIFARNFGVITSPSSLPVGETIVIPCIEGDAAMTPDAAALAARQPATSAPSDSEAADSSEAASGDSTAPAPAANSQDTTVPASDATAAAPASGETSGGTSDNASAPAQPAFTAPRKGFRLLTANGQQPYSDRSLRAGGMVTELVSLSMANVGLSEQHKIVFIDDRNSHLSDLLLEGSFDAGFPWLRPRCDDLEALQRLAPEQAWMCETFEFSEPFYEYVNGFFVRKGEFSTNRTTFDDFSGGSICRPAGETVMDLAVKGLTSDDVELVRPASVADCFALLMTEEVDAVSVEIFAAEDVLADGDMFDQVEELPGLSLLWTVHAIAAKGKPGAREAMDALNQGLLDLKISGRWFRVVARHLAAQSGG